MKNGQLDINVKEETLTFPQILWPNCSNRIFSKSAEKHGK